MIVFPRIDKNVNKEDETLQGYSGRWRLSIFPATKWNYEKFLKLI